MSAYPAVASSIFVLDMRFPSASLDAALRLLVPASTEVVAQRECLDCRVLVDAVQGTQVRYQEEWASQAALDRRVRSDEFRRLLIAADLSALEPRVLLGTLHGTLGLAHLSEVRAGASTVLPPSSPATGGAGAPEV